MEKENDKSNKLQIWKIIIIPIVVVLIPIIYNVISEEEKVKKPHFIIQNPILNLDETELAVSCQNCDNLTPSQIIAVINNIKFSNIEKLNSGNQKPSWIIDLKKLGIIEDVIVEGENQIRLGFKDENLSENYFFHFKKNVKAPNDKRKTTLSEDSEKVTPPKLKYGKIEVLLPSRFKKSKIYIDGKEADIIDRSLTKVILKVAYKSQNSKIEIREEGKLVCEEELILDKFKILTPCAN